MKHTDIGQKAVIRNILYKIIARREEKKSVRALGAKSRAAPVLEAPLGGAVTDPEADVEPEALEAPETPEAPEALEPPEAEELDADAEAEEPG